jgi:hypothetical protein
MSSDTVDPETQHLLEVILERFRETGEWPRLDALRHALVRNDDDLDVVGVGRRLDPAYGHVELGYQTKATLTIHGIALCRGSGEILEDCLRTVKFAYHRYVETGPDARITSQDLAREFEMSAVRLNRTRELIAWVPGMNGGGSDDDGWHVLVTADIARFKRTESVPDLLAQTPRARGLNAFAPPTPLPTNPGPAAVVSGTLARKPAVFISVAEQHKDDLGRPFRDLLGPKVSGYIVSDLPLVDEAYSPDEKVEAYLEKADAAVIFATADIASDSGDFTRPNISEEIARARSKRHLRTRICVLREPGVTLPSNTNPAYSHLDPMRPGAAFVSALEQLRAWGFDLNVPSVPPPRSAPASAPSLGRSLPTLDTETERTALEHALGRVPELRHTTGRPSVALTVVSVPRRSILRPAELESTTFADRFETAALTGPGAVLHRRHGTTTKMSGNSLVSQQESNWTAIDAEATLAVVRQLRAKSGREIGLWGVIEEDVVEALERELAFADHVLTMVDPSESTTHVVLVAILLGAGSSEWRTRAEQAANPTSMTMDITAGDRIVERFSPPARLRAALSTDRPALARDLMVLLRRHARQAP